MSNSLGVSWISAPSRITRRLLESIRRFPQTKEVWPLLGWPPPQLQHERVGFLHTTPPRRHTVPSLPVSVDAGFGSVLQNHCKVRKSNDTKFTLFIKSPPLQQCMVFLNIPPFGGRYQQHIGRMVTARNPKYQSGRGARPSRWAAGV